MLRHEFHPGRLVAGAGSSSRSVSVTGGASPASVDGPTEAAGEGGMKPVDGIEIAFKRSMDPYDLLNPGKLAIDAAAVSASAGAAFGTRGWWKDRAPAKGEAA